MPVDGGLCRIAACFPGGDHAADSLLVSEASVHTLGRPHGELDFRPIEPTAMLGCVVEIQRPQDATGFGRRKGRLQGRRGMRIQVIQDDTDHSRLGDMEVHQVLHPVGKILAGAPVSDLHMPPALPRLEAHQQVAGTLPALFVVVPHRLTGPHRQCLTALTDQWVELFIQADEGILGLIRLRIQVQDIFHAPHTLRAHTGNTPALLLPRLESICLSVRRTVSSEMASTTRRVTSLSASICIVQHCRPSLRIKLIILYR
jgi:hypothetical protein